MNAYETALQDAEALRRCPETGLFSGTWRSPSQRKMHRPALEKEVGITWVLPEGKARAMPWLRERFWSKRPKRSDLIAFSTDSRGRCIRCWLAKAEDQDAYERLLQAGAGTAPIEAIHPPSIAVGRPALPAHPFLLPLMWQAIAASEGNPIELPQPDQHSSAQKLIEIESASRQGLRPGGL